MPIASREGPRNRVHPEPAGTRGPAAPTTRKDPQLQDAVVRCPSRISSGSADPSAASWGAGDCHGWRVPAQPPAPTGFPQGDLAAFGSPLCAFTYAPWLAYGPSRQTSGSLKRGADGTSRPTLASVERAAFWAGAGRLPAHANVSPPRTRPLAAAAATKPRRARTLRRGVNGGDGSEMLVLEVFGGVNAPKLTHPGAKISDVLHVSISVLVADNDTGWARILGKMPLGGGRSDGLAQNDACAFALAQSRTPAEGDLRQVTSFWDGMSSRARNKPCSAELFGWISGTQGTAACRPHRAIAGKSRWPAPLLLRPGRGASPSAPQR